MPKRPEQDIYPVVRESLIKLNKSSNREEAISMFKQLLSLLEEYPAQSSELILYIKSEWPKIKETSPSSNVELRFGFNTANKQVILLVFDNRIVSNES